jgi:hypothetical protein
MRHLSVADQSSRHRSPASYHVVHDDVVESVDSKRQPVQGAHHVWYDLIEHAVSCTSSNENATNGNVRRSSQTDFGVRTWLEKAEVLAKVQQQHEALQEHGVVAGKVHCTQQVGLPGCE